MDVIGKTGTAAASVTHRAVGSLPVDPDSVIRVEGCPAPFGHQPPIGGSPCRTKVLRQGLPPRCVIVVLPSTGTTASLPAAVAVFQVEAME